MASNRDTCIWAVMKSSFKCSPTPTQHVPPAHHSPRIYLSNHKSRIENLPRCISLISSKIRTYAGLAWVHKPFCSSSMTISLGNTHTVGYVCRESYHGYSAGYFCGGKFSGRNLPLGRGGPSFALARVAKTAITRQRVMVGVSFMLAGGVRLAERAAG